MNSVWCIVYSVWCLILHVGIGESINTALDSARTVYAERGEQTTVLIEPGVYQEELTIDIPGLTLKNTSETEEVRITWYYGHGYQYRSMGDAINYGGSRSRRWNASVLVTAPDFYAERITFENSFNLYVSSKEAEDSLYIVPEYTAREMPVRPKEVGSTEVQKKLYRERAAAISFTETATNAHLKNCTALGRQDVVYGDQGASVYWEGGALKGAVDFIFGAMKLVVDRATIVANINGEENDKCYIAAGRSEGTRGMLFYRCHIRLANEKELQIINLKSEITNTTAMVWLSRPWRSWGETVWAYTTWDEGILNTEAWSTDLLRKRPEYDPENPCPNSYEYLSQDNSVGRPSWVTVLTEPQLPDGTQLDPKNW